METKVVKYPKTGAINVFFKSPKAHSWGSYKSSKNPNERLNFDSELQAIEFCEHIMASALERDNAVTVWQSTPKHNI